jgi:hypothetical protein
MSSIKLQRNAITVQLIIWHSIYSCSSEGRSVSGTWSKMLRIIIGPLRHEVTENWGKLNGPYWGRGQFSSSWRRWWKTVKWSGRRYALQPVASHMDPSTVSEVQTAVPTASWLQIQRSGFDSRSYQIFWEVVGLERGTLSFVITNEELLERKSSGSGLESRDYGLREPSRWPCGVKIAKWVGGWVDM